MYTTKSNFPKYDYLVKDSSKNDFNTVIAFDYINISDIKKLDSNLRKTNNYYNIKKIKVFFKLNNNINKNQNMLFKIFSGDYVQGKFNYNLSIILIRN